ncbi:hypothetical protein [Lentisalinibacter salinarum]|uniref:hypothetical protein n=1 Tax=Lentisalinibacter salinarum TaxID=2992239 RepID=UPI00386C2B52
MAKRTARRKTKHRRKKDRIVQARIPEELDEELHTRAGEFGLSVSAIVRNVLLNTFNLVEDVVNDSTGIARALGGAAPQGADGEPGTVETKEEDSAIVGWQELTLNVNGVCHECNTVLRRGDQAAVGVPLSARPVFLCPDCLDSLAK